MNKLIKLVICASLISSSIFLKINAEAKQSTNSNPWGFSGLINMPTADILRTGEFDVTANYLLKNPGFIVNGHMGVFDKLELGVVGGIPNAGFSGIAGNLKYQLIKPTSQAPTSLAVGLNLVGLAKNTTITNGNYLYMVLSQDFNLKLKDNSIYNICSGHFGFGGNHFGSRVMIGADIPFTDYVNLNLEYLGKIENMDEMFNFGIKAKPIPKLPDFTISLLSTGTSLSGFANTEVFLNIGYSARISPIQKAELEEPKNSEKIAELSKEEKIDKKEIVKKIPIPPPTPEATPLPEKTKEPIVEKKTEPEIQKKVEEVKPTVIPVVQESVKPSIIPPPVVIAQKKETAKPEVKTGYIKGYVKNSSNSQKVANVSILIKSNNSNFEQKTETDELGIFKFNNIPKGEYSIVFEKDSFGTVKKNLIVTPDETTEIITDIVSDTGSISGKVLDEKGVPLANVTIQFDKTKKVVSDKDGKYSFNNIPAGNQTLTIYKKNKEIKKFEVDIIAGSDLSKEIIVSSEKKVVIKKEVVVKKEVASTPIKVEQKVIPKKIETKTIKTEPKKDIVIKNSSKLSGKITDKNGALKGAKLILEGDKLTVMTTSAQDGIYIIKGLPLGTYKMTVSKQGYVSRVFSVKIKESKDAKYDLKLEDK